jgi:hypothetical protein
VDKSAPFRLFRSAEDWFETLGVEFGLVVEVSKGKSELLTRWHTSDRKIKPCLVELAFGKVRLTIGRNPQIKLILREASRCPRQITGTEVGPDHDATVSDTSNRPGWEVI